MPASWAINSINLMGKPSVSYKKKALLGRKSRTKLRKVGRDNRCAESGPSAPKAKTKPRGSPTMTCKIKQEQNPLTYQKLSLAGQPMITSSGRCFNQHPRAFLLALTTSPPLPAK